MVVLVNFVYDLEKKIMAHYEKYFMVVTGDLDTAMILSTQSHVKIMNLNKTSKNPV